MASVAAALEWRWSAPAKRRFPTAWGGRITRCISTAARRLRRAEGTGIGANARRFKGHNREQFKRFSAIPNPPLRGRQRVGALPQRGPGGQGRPPCRRRYRPRREEPPTLQDAQAIERLLRRSSSPGRPIIPTDRKGKIDLKGFAGPARAAVPDAARRRDRRARGRRLAPGPAGKGLAAVALSGCTDEQFADAYAQTVTFALLLGRSEGADPLTLGAARVRPSPLSTTCFRARSKF